MLLVLVLLVLLLVLVLLVLLLLPHPCRDVMTATKHKHACTVRKKQTREGEQWLICVEITFVHLLTHSLTHSLTR